MQFYFLDRWIVDVSYWSKTRKFSASRFLSESTSGIFAQLPNILIRHSKLYGHHQNIIIWIMALTMCLYVSNYSLLQKPLDFSAINRIAREAINFPANNSLRFVILNSCKHVIKYRPARNFRRAFFYEFFYNRKIFPLREHSQFINLRFNREDLLVLHIG